VFQIYLQVVEKTRFHERYGGAFGWRCGNLPRLEEFIEQSGRVQVIARMDRLVSGCLDGIACFLPISVHIGCLAANRHPERLGYSRRAVEENPDITV
jgi:hypothetical protein